MADRKGLRVIGAVYGGFTVTIALIASLVVGAHINAAERDLAGMTEAGMTEIGAAVRLSTLP